MFTEYKQIFLQNVMDVIGDVREGKLSQQFGHQILGKIHKGTFYDAHRQGWADAELGELLVYMSKAYELNEPVVAGTIGNWLRWYFLGAKFPG